MKLFAKEKDIVLKIVNSILIVGAIISIIIMISTGINIINKPEILSYSDYEKEICTLDKLEYEGTDVEGREKYDEDIKKACKENYLLDKQEKTRMNKSNVNNFLISLSATLVLLLTIHILNKKI